MDKKAAIGEEEAKHGESKVVYKSTKEIMRKCRITNRPVKDANGNIVSDSVEISVVWALHLEKILNRPHQADPQDILRALFERQNQHRKAL